MFFKYLFLFLTVKLAHSEPECSWNEILSSESGGSELTCPRDLINETTWIVESDSTVFVMCFVNQDENIFENAPKLNDKERLMLGLVWCNKWPDKFSMFIDIFANITELAIVSSNISEFKWNFFDVSNALVKFSLINAKNFSSIDERVFRNLQQLESLTLIKVNCGLLPSKLLVSNTNLRNFTLSRSQVEINGPLLADKPNLINVVMTNNKLKYLPGDVFEGSDNIEVIDLSENRIAQFDANTFMGKHLKLLDVSSSNNIDIFKKMQLLPCDHTIPTINVVDASYVMSQSFNSVFFWDFDTIDAKLVWLQDSTFRTIHMSAFCFPNVSIVFNITSGFDSFFLPSVNLDLVSSSSNITIMSLNDVYCSSVMHPILRAQSEHKQLHLEFGDAKCSSPPRLKGRFVRDITVMDLLDDLLLCYPDCSCFYRIADLSLMVNCSNRGIDAFPNLDFIDKLVKKAESRIERIWYYLENNSISKLPIFPLGFNYIVPELLVSNNKILEVVERNLPKGLDTFDLRNNNIEKLSDGVVQKMKDVITIRLDGNPWICDCSTIEFFKFIKSRKNITAECNNLDNRLIANLSESDACLDYFLFIGVSGAVTFGLVGVAIALFYKFNRDIKIFLYAHDMCLCFASEQELDKDKIYDAFFCFAGADQELIEEIILELDDDYGILIGVRDWPPGEMVPELISNSVQQSRRTVIFLTQNFIDSQWCRHEFRAAQVEAFNEKRKRIIVITYGDIEQSKEMCEELKSYLRLHLYIKREDPRFWQRLRYAMPHKNMEFNGPEDMRPTFMDLSNRY